MPAESQRQQHLFGMAIAYKRGELKDASPEVKRLAEEMPEEKLREFAATPTRGLPVRAVLKAVGYKLQGMRQWQGLTVAIENRKGSVRRGVVEDGKPWRTKMLWDYGGIRGTSGFTVDSDLLDCFLGPNENAQTVYVIHQQDPKTSTFDEDKVMLGWDSWEAARDAYLAHYDDQRFLPADPKRAFTAMSVEQFKDRIADRRDNARVREEEGRPAVRGMLKAILKRTPLDRPHKCKHCDSPAVKAVLWAEGMAFVPACEKHLAQVRAHIRRIYGKPDGEVDLPRVLKGVKAVLMGIQPDREFSSTQINLPEEIAAQVRALAAKIRDEDLAADGREKDPHVTVQFGLHTNDPEEVRKVVADEPPVEFTLGQTSLFPAKAGAAYDVVKLDVTGPDLERLNAKLAGALPHTDTYPEYYPHLTLAYVKPGRGQQYAGENPLIGTLVTGSMVTFSGKDRQEVGIPLRGERVVKAWVHDTGGRYRYDAGQRSAEVDVSRLDDLHRAAAKAGGKHLRSMTHADYFGAPGPTYPTHHFLEAQNPAKVSRAILQEPTAAALDARCQALADGSHHVNLNLGGVLHQFHISPVSDAPRGRVRKSIPLTEDFLSCLLDLGEVGVPMAPGLVEPLRKACLGRGIVPPEWLGKAYEQQSTAR